MRELTITLLLAVGLTGTALADVVDPELLQARLASAGGWPAETLLLRAQPRGDILEVDLDPGRLLTPGELDALVGAADHALGDGYRGVAIRVPDGSGELVPLHRLFVLPPVPDKAAGASIPPPSHPSDPPGWEDGALADKTIYLSQCHGWYWHDDYHDWYTQRPNLFDTAEDFHNTEGMNQYLMRYLLNAGARVVTVKESDLQERMVIVDDGDAGYSESGTWEDSVQPGFASGHEPYAYGTDPFELGGNRWAETGETPTASATWTPDIPGDGHYQVYVSYSQDSSRAPDAHYVVRHPAGASDVYVDQRVHGSTWVYLGRFFFRAGSDEDHGSVALLDDSTEPGAIVSADAVRFGGGWGDVSRGGTTSGHERWEEAAIYYTQYAGAPSTVYDPYGDGDGSDPSSRSRFADWEHEEGEDAVYFSWHSNACGDCGASGTSTYVYGPCGPGECDDFTGYPGSDDMAQSIQDSVVSTIDQLWSPGWSDRGVRVAYFSEVSPSNNDEMPAALIELAFHDTESDTELLKHPRFRRDVSRGMMHGIIDYFADRDGIELTYPPEPPTHLQVFADGEGILRVRWEAPLSGGVLGAPADRYRVYLSHDGRSFEEGVEIDSREVLIEQLHGYDPIHVRVTAVNDGGESFPTPTLGAIPTPADTRILLVDGFDRLDRGLLVWRDAGGNVDWLTHMDLERMNRFDYTVEHLDALAAAGVPVDVADASLIADGLEVSTDYDLVVWFAGNESTEDETFSKEEQDWIAAFMDGGGKLFVSGAEIGWDLDYRGDGDDLAFYQSYLLAGMAEDDADTYAADPSSDNIFAGIGAMAFSDGTGSTYDARYPDVLDVLAGATSAMVYDGDPGAPAALTADDGSLVYLGFPFETLLDPGQREEVMLASLDFLLPDYEPPEWPAGDDDDDDDVVGDDDDDDDDDDATVPEPYVRDDDDGGCECGIDGIPSPLPRGLVALGAAFVGLRFLVGRRRKRS